MFKAIINLLLVCFICPYIFIACKNATAKYSLKSNFKLNLQTTPGFKYYYTINKKTETKLEIDDKEIKNLNSSTIGFIYEKVKDSADCYILKITYDKLHILSKAKDNEREISATGTSSSFDPVEKILGSIMGSSVYITLNKMGDVLSVTGTKEITEKISTALNTQDPSTIQIVQDQMSKLVGETFVHNNLEQGFKLFPDSTLTVGESWSRKTKQSSDITLNATTVYTLKSVADNIAKINGEGTIYSKENAALVMGCKVATNLKGTQTSNFKIDTYTGMLINESSDSKIRGTINFLEKEVPVEITLTNEIYVVKM